MQPSKQFCRYYQRGSCQYGARCKFVHEIEQPSKPNNSFGFGVQQNSGSVQQQNNPFGFGVQSGLNSQSQHSRSAQQQPNPFGFGVKGNNPSSKPFDNKWSRFSANPGTGAVASSRKGDGQSPAATHSCTDPDSCKKQIAEDFEHERPLWKLTCYSHHKYAPCDITGDVSYEELRMSAYDDAKSGMSLPAIVEKERGLLNAKLVEFEALLRNPYKGRSSSIATQSPFPQATPNAFMNNVASPSVWTFGQPASSINTGSGFGGVASSNAGLNQATIFQRSDQSSTTFGTPNSPFGGSSNSTLPSASSFGANKPSFPNSFVTAPFSSASLQTSISTISNSMMHATDPNSASHENVRAVETAGFINKIQGSDVSVDDKIWLKEKWRPGEIPETPPPERFIF